MANIFEGWVPKYVAMPVAARPGQLVTAEHWNNLWNLAYVQGDYAMRTITEIIPFLQDWNLRIPPLEEGMAALRTDVDYLRGWLDATSQVLARAQYDITMLQGETSRLGSRLSSIELTWIPKVSQALTAANNAEALATQANTNSATALATASQAAQDSAAAVALVDGKEDKANKDIAGGYAGLDMQGKVSIDVLPEAALAGLQYAGVWDAANNVPELFPDSHPAGTFFIVSAAGTQMAQTWAVGDWAIADVDTWDRVHSTNNVISVNGRMGEVVITAADVGLVVVQEDGTSTTAVMSQDYTSRRLSALGTGLSTQNTRLLTVESTVASFQTNLSNLQGDLNFWKDLVNAHTSNSDVHVTVADKNVWNLQRLAVPSGTDAFQAMFNPVSGNRPILRSFKSVAGQSIIGPGDIPLVSTLNGQNGALSLKTVDNQSILTTGNIPVGVKSLGGYVPDGAGNLPLRTVAGQALIGQGDITVTAALEPNTDYNISYQAPSVEDPGLVVNSIPLGGGHYLICLQIGVSFYSVTLSKTNQLFSFDHVPARSGMFLVGQTNLLLDPNGSIILPVYIRMQNQQYYVIFNGDTPVTVPEGPSFNGFITFFI